MEIHKIGIDLHFVILKKMQLHKVTVIKFSCLVILVSLKVKKKLTPGNVLENWTLKNR